MSVGMKLAIVLLAATMLSVDPAYASAAQAKTIASEQTIEGVLKSSESQAYSLDTVKQGDFVSGWIDQRGISVSIELIGGDGATIRKWADISRGKYQFSFVADGSGPYRLTLRTAERGSGAYTLGLGKIVQAHTQTVEQAPQPQSPRLKSLQQQLAAAATTLDAFWTAVGVEGTPLVEAIDDKTFLVTFLWRGHPRTREVQLVWVLPPFEPHTLTQLPGTDVWYRSETLPRGARFTYQLAPDAPSAPGGIQAVAQADPLNPRRYGGASDTDKFALSSLAELPGVAPQPWVERRTGVKTGHVETTRLASQILGNDREVAVYTPDGYRRRGQAYDLLIVFDQEAYLDRVPTPVILDNLIAANEIRPMVAVILGNSSMAGRFREFPPNPDFAAFMAKEVMPWIRERYNVTRDPARVVVAGSSYGGLASAYVAFKHPDIFGNVLAQSGSFWWSPTRDPGNPAALDKYSEPAWLVRQFAASPTLPLRFYIDAGWFEGGEAGGILDNSRFLRDILRAKGNVVHYREFIGGHDYVNWRGTLADGLIALVGLRDQPQVKAN